MCIGDIFTAETKNHNNVCVNNMAIRDNIRYIKSIFIYIKTLPGSYFNHVNGDNKLTTVIKCC